MSPGRAAEILLLEAGVHPDQIFRMKVWELISEAWAYRARQLHGEEMKLSDWLETDCGKNYGGPVCEF